MAHSPRLLIDTTAIVTRVLEHAADDDICEYASVPVIDVSRSTLLFNAAR